METQTVFLKGTGKYTGQNLKSETANVIIRGPGTAFVWATDELNSSIHGSGNIHYFKHSKSPDIINEMIEGEGKVSPYTEGMKR